MANGIRVPIFIVLIGLGESGLDCISILNPDNEIKTW